MHWHSYKCDCWLVVYNLKVCLRICASYSILLKLWVYHIPWWLYLLHWNEMTTCIRKAWTVIERLSIIWKSNLSDKMKCELFQDISMSVLLYGYTTWTLTNTCRKSYMVTTRRCFMLFWTNPGNSTLQNRSCMATCLQSHKPFK